MKLSTRLRKPTAWYTALTVAAAAFTLAAPLRAQIGIYIGTPPPAIRYERRPPMPAQGYVWTDGFYEPYNGHYRWHPGYWQQPPYPNAYYSHPHYDHYPEGWRLHEGHWDHEDHGDHQNDEHRDRDDRH